YAPYITHTLTRQPSPPRVTLQQAWLDESRPDREVCVAGLTLTRTQLSERNPYLNVSVAGDLIEGHNDIGEPQIIEFVKQMILLSSLPDKARKTGSGVIDPRCPGASRS
ncbi:MAG TPA: hypothetical protein VJS90_21715, partial [Pseudomonas sp.]|uniref:hypothetical protein n=1 Tax=Pseudomonas sp. TaxID=306 RepID=UPI002B4A0876